MSKSQFTHSLFITSILFFLNFISFGQTTPTFQQIKEQNPNELAVYVKKSEHLIFEIKKDSLQVSADIYEELLHLKVQSNILSEDAVYHSTFNQIKNLEAYTLLPTEKEGKYKTLKVTNFKEENDMGRGTFFDDNKKTTIVYPSVSEGAKTVLSYNRTYNDPRFLTAYFFTDYHNVMESEFKLTYPENVKLRFEFFSIDAKNLIHTEEKKGNKITVTWKAKNIKMPKIDAGCPNIRYFAPHIMVYIEHVTFKKRVDKFSGDANAFYDFYYDFVKKVNLEKDASVQNTVDSLVKGCKTELEKTKKIFYWVQDHIRYIAFEDGYGGFVPREGKLIYERRYGDCKDMASIITYMLHHAGIKGYLTWVGSRDIPYTIDQNPAPNTFNHMIATAEVDGKYIFLDATGSYTPFGFPTDMIQGKQVLISKNAKEFDKVFVPVIEKEKNRIYDSVTISISNNSIKGLGSGNWIGFPKYDLTHQLSGISPEKEKEYLGAYLEKGNNKFNLEKYTINNLKDRDQTLTIDYQFKLDDYAQKVGNELYINLHLEKIFKNADFEDNRELPLERDYKFEDENTVILNIPTGYKITYLPENVSFNNSKFGFDVTYIQEKNRIIMKRKFWFNELLLYKADFENWNKCIKQLNKAYKEVLTLNKI